MVWHFIQYLVARVFYNFFIILSFFLFSAFASVSFSCVAAKTKVEYLIQDIVQRTREENNKCHNTDILHLYNYLGITFICCKLKSYMHIYYLDLNNSQNQDGENTRHSGPRRLCRMDSTSSLDIDKTRSCINRIKGTSHGSSKIHILCYLPTKAGK